MTNSKFTPSRAVKSALQLLLFLLIAATGAAQVHIKGTIVREGDPPEGVEQAAVRLLRSTDSVMVKGTVTDREGHFDLTGIRQGNYLLNVTYVGLDPVNQLLRISGSKTPVDVGTITMHDDGVLLGEAVVTARMVEVQVKNDTVEYNAEAYKVAEGSMLEDLLKKMPGVEVSTEGKVTVNGKEIKKILVDGKEFFSDDPKVASKNLPAKMVDKVQTYDKKSDVALMTGFDDGNEEAVINLTIKPGMKQGWFGNAFAGAGSRGRYDVNAMLDRFVDSDQHEQHGLYRLCSCRFQQRPRRWTPSLRRFRRRQRNHLFGQHWHQLQQKFLASPDSRRQRALCRFRQRGARQD